MKKVIIVLLALLLSGVWLANAGVSHKAIFYSGKLNSSVIRQLAKFDLVVLPADTDPTQLTILRSENPQLIILASDNFVETDYKNVASVPTAWLFQDSSGHPVSRKNQQKALLNFSHSCPKINFGDGELNWGNFFVKYWTKKLQAGLFDGIYFNELLPSAFLDSLPLDLNKDGQAEKGKAVKIFLRAEERKIILDIHKRNPNAFLIGKGIFITGMNGTVISVAANDNQGKKEFLKQVVPKAIQPPTNIIVAEDISAKEKAFAFANELECYFGVNELTDYPWAKLGEEHLAQQNKQKKVELSNSSNLMFLPFPSFESVDFDTTVNCRIETNKNKKISWIALIKIKSYNESTHLAEKSSKGINADGKKAYNIKITPGFYLINIQFEDGSWAKEKDDISPARVFINGKHLILADPIPIKPGPYFCFEVDAQGNVIAKWDKSLSIGK